MMEFSATPFGQLVYALIMLLFSILIVKNRIRHYDVIFMYLAFIRTVESALIYMICLLGIPVYASQAFPIFYLISAVIWGISFGLLVFRIRKLPRTHIIALSVLAVIGLLLLSIVSLALITKGEHIEDLTRTGMTDVWKLHDVDLVTEVDATRDGNVSWDRGFSCTQDEFSWEYAVASLPEYTQDFEIKTAWKIGDMVYYVTNTGFYSYPDVCNNPNAGSNPIFLLFPPAR